MPEIRPISAVTFDTTRSRDVSDYIAPPYDVLDAQSKQQLLAGNPNNIVKVDLPHLPVKTVGPDEIYQRAGKTYQRWLREGLLRQRPTLGLYVCQQTYSVDSRTFSRRGLIANVRLVPCGPGREGRGGIHAHEQTLPAAREDRLKLLCATAAQLSPIFGIYSDPDEKVRSMLEEVISAQQPDLTARSPIDDVYHEVWMVTDSSSIAAFEEAFRARDVFIADGHHRYQTALNYKQQLAGRGKAPEAANFVMFTLVAMEDPGLSVLPTHRVICGMTGFTMEKLQALLADRDDLAVFETAYGPDQLAQLAESLGTGGQHAMGLFESGAQRCHVFETLGEVDPLKTIRPDRSATWRKLDVAVLHELLIDRVLRPHFGADAITYSFTADLQELGGMVNTDSAGSRRLAVLLQPTPIDAVRKVAGELLPPKSTYFHPKLPSGLVINPLSP